jgi:hypothetical protein
MLDLIKQAYQEIGRNIVVALPIGWRSAYVLFEPEAVDVASYMAFVRGEDDAFTSFKLPWPAYLSFMKTWERSASDSGAPWTSLTFIVHNSGTFDVEYGYDALQQSDEGRRKRAWMLSHGIRT